MSIAQQSSRPPVPPKPTHWSSSSSSAAASPTAPTTGPSSAAAAAPRPQQPSPELPYTVISRAAHTVNGSYGSVSESRSSRLPPTDELSPPSSLSVSHSHSQVGRASASESALATQLTLNALLSEIQRVHGVPSVAGDSDAGVIGTYWGISPVRRTFMLIVIFDLLFTFLLWLICTQVS